MILFLEIYIEVVKCVKGFEVCNLFLSGLENKVCIRVCVCVERKGEGERESKYGNVNNYWIKGKVCMGVFVLFLYFFIC